MKRLAAAARILPEFLTDAVRFSLWSHHSPFVPKPKSLFYKIIITAHTVEKGLSLENPRSLFGKSKITDLRRMLSMYPQDATPFPRLMALGAMQTYLEFHRQRGVTDPFLDDLETYLKAQISSSTGDHGGIKSTAGIYDAIRDRKLEYNEFLQSRHSSRTFQQEALPSALISSIVATAASAPSQCNRQSTRVHCYQDRKRIAELLSLQGGSRGFSEQVPNLFLLTFDITGWGGPNQRNQGYIDAGLLSMGVMWSCHAHCVACCALNLAISNKRERELRKLASLPDNERTVMMIAFGYPSESHTRAARSCRLDGDSILIKHR